jgi:hypothetical protein
MEESPSDSGLSDGTKTTNQDEINDSLTKNSAIIDLSKPLSKEEMLAIIQIVRELWKKQFDCDLPDVQIKATVPSISSTRRVNNIGQLSTKSKTEFHSTPTLNKLSAELSDIKDKLKRFNSERQHATIPKMKSIGKYFDQFEHDMNRIVVETESNQVDINENTVDDESAFVTFGNPLTVSDL